MELFEKLTYMKQLQKELEDEMAGVKEDIVLNVRKESTIVKPIPGTSGVIGVVQFSDLITSKSWAPESFFGDEQANAVSRGLSHATSPDAICKALHEMGTSGKAPGTGGQKVILNERTISAIRESDAFKFAEDNLMKQEAEA